MPTKTVPAAPASASKPAQRGSPARPAPQPAKLPVPVPRTASAQQRPAQAATLPGAAARRGPPPVASLIASKSPEQKGSDGRGGAREGAGRPPYAPTEEQRRNVEAMAGFGIPQAEICLLMINPETGRPIDEKTLRAHFHDELAQGHVKANSAIGQALFKKATGSGPQSVAAAIFWLKCRAGWREQSVIQVDVKSGVLVAPNAMTPEQWIAAMAAANAVKERPGSPADEH